MVLAAAVVACSLLHAVPVVPYAANRDRFTVDLPGTPALESEKGQAQGDAQMTNSYAVGVEKGSVVIMAMKDHDFDEVTPAELKEGFDAFRAGMLKGGKIYAEKKVASSGIPGIEIKTRSKDGDVIGRLYIGEGRTWTVLCVINRGATPQLTGCDRALSTFTVLHGTGAPEADDAPPSPGPAPRPGPITPPPNTGGQNAKGPEASLSVRQHTLTISSKGTQWIATVDASLSMLRSVADLTVRVDAECSVGKAGIEKGSSEAFALPATSSDLTVRAAFTFTKKPHRCDVRYIILKHGAPLNITGEAAPMYPGMSDQGCWTEGKMESGPCLDE